MVTKKPIICLSDFYQEHLSAIINSLLAPPLVKVFPSSDNKVGVFWGELPARMFIQVAHDFFHFFNITIKSSEKQQMVNYCPSIIQNLAHLHLLVTLSSKLCISPPALLAFTVLKIHKQSPKGKRY